VTRRVAAPDAYSPAHARPTAHSARPCRDRSDERRSHAPPAAPTARRGPSQQLGVHGRDFDDPERAPPATRTRRLVALAPIALGTHHPPRPFIHRLTPRRAAIALKAVQAAPSEVQPRRLDRVDYPSCRSWDTSRSGAQSRVVMARKLSTSADRRRAVMGGVHRVCRIRMRRVGPSDHSLALDG
jgi:hypothetical protein